MTGPSVIRRDKNMLQKWLGPNRGTHWTIAGAVAVIILGGYLIYNNRESNNSTNPRSATVQIPASVALAPAHIEEVK